MPISTSAAFHYPHQYKFCIITPHSLIAPLIYYFFGWLVKQARELQLDMILLSSRDGFIIERIYEIFKDKGMNLPPMAYFYSSRAAALPAGIMDDDDIRYIAGYPYVGNIEDMLKQRLNLSVDEILPRDDFPGLDDEGYVLLHRDAIMSRAETARRNYKAYIDKFGIPKGENVGFFDFVSSGTCLKSLSDFAGFNMTGLFFVLNADKKSEYKSGVRIIPMFGTLNLVEKRFNFIQVYVFLETIFTSYEPMLSGFDGNGSPVFMKDRRTERHIRDVREMHAAIIDYVKNSQIELSDICEADKEVPDFLLKLLYPQYSRIDTDYFDSAAFTDEFNNTACDFSYIVK